MKMPVNCDWHFLSDDFDFVRVMIKYFTSFVGDDDQIFDPAAQGIGIIDARLDREDVVGFRQIFKGGRNIAVFVIFNADKVT